MNCSNANTKMCSQVTQPQAFPDVSDLLSSAEDYWAHF